MEKSAGASRDSGFCPHLEQGSQAMGNRGQENTKIHWNRLRRVLKFTPEISRGT
jgi:hypothetical protein